MPRLRQALLAVLAMLAAGCGMRTDLYKEVDRNVAVGQYTAAAAVVEANLDEYGQNSGVLFNLELGTLQHYGGLPNESTRRLLTAERMMEDLYTESVSKTLGSFLLNDNVLPYAGEDFEKVMVNYFLAMNFTRLGSYEEALVEARKVDDKLRLLSRQYDGKNTYKEDAFVRFVTGALYEANGELNDAFIAYRKAHEAYGTYAEAFGTPSPSFLEDDLIRTAGLLNFSDEREQYERTFGRKFRTPGKDEGSILALIYSGRGPIKVQKKVTVSVPDSEGVSHTFSVAVPSFRARGGAPRRYTVRVIGAKVAEVHAEIAQDITRIAERNLDERIALIYLKAGGRALMKFLAAEEAKKAFRKEVKDDALNILFGAVTDVAMTASEQADLRIWRTLPDKIQIARLNLPAGSYQVQVIRDDGRTFASDKLDVKAGSVVFTTIPDIN